MSRLMDRHSSKTGRNIIIGQTHAEICKSRRTEHDPRPRGEGGEEGVVARVASARSKRERERERELKSGRWSFPRLCSTIYVLRIKDPSFSLRVES